MTWTTDIASDSQVAYDTIYRTPLTYLSGSSNRCDAGGFVTVHCFNLTGLSANTTYYYTVISLEPGGKSSATNPSNQFTTTATTTSVTTPTADTTPPSVPANFTASVTSSTQINLSWSASADNIAVKGYRIYRGGIQIANVTTGTSYSNTGLTASTAYSYTISAYDAVDNASGQSSSVSATTLSPAITTPTNFNAIATSPTSVSLTWSASQGSVYRYQIRRFTNNLDGAQTGAEVLAPATSYTDTTAQPGTSYIYWVQAMSLDYHGSDNASVSLTTPTSSTASSTSLYLRPKNLAAISQALSAIQEKLLKLLQE